MPSLARAIDQRKFDAVILASSSRSRRIAFLFCRPAAYLPEGHDSRLFYYVSDLLNLNGWDRRPCALIDRKKTAHAALGLEWNAPRCPIGRHRHGDGLSAGLPRSPPTALCRRLTPRATTEITVGFGANFCLPAPAVIDVLCDGQDLLHSKFGAKA